MDNLDVSTNFISINIRKDIIQSVDMMNKDNIFSANDILKMFIQPFMDKVDMFKYAKETTKHNVKFQWSIDDNNCRDKIRQEENKISIIQFNISNYPACGCTER